MDRSERAKQFMPFDAVKGLREALEAKEREIKIVSHNSENEIKRYNNKDI